MLKGYGSIFIYIITELITDKFRIKKKKKKLDLNEIKGKI